MCNAYLPLAGKSAERLLSSTAARARARGVHSLLRMHTTPSLLHPHTTRKLHRCDLWVTVLVLLMHRPVETEADTASSPFTDSAATVVQGSDVLSWVCNTNAKLARVERDEGKGGGSACGAVSLTLISTPEFASRHPLLSGVSRDAHRPSNKGQKKSKRAQQIQEQEERPQSVEEKEVQEAMLREFDTLLPLPSPPQHCSCSEQPPPPRPPLLFARTRLWEAAVRDRII
jgi:hypothetical protein